MTAIIIQPQFMPIATFTGANGRPVPTYITNEWRRPLEQMAQQIATLQESSGSATGDVVTNDTDRRLVLRDEDGRYWQLTVDTDGVLITTDLGMSI